jgi:hypothetical protein
MFRKSTQSATPLLQTAPGTATSTGPDPAARSRQNPWAADQDAASKGHERQPGAGLWSRWRTVADARGRLLPGGLRCPRGAASIRAVQERNACRARERTEWRKCLMDEEVASSCRSRTGHTGARFWCDGMTRAPSEGGDRGSTTGVGLRPRAPPSPALPHKLHGEGERENSVAQDRILPLSRDSGGGGPCGRQFDAVRRVAIHRHPSPRAVCADGPPSRAPVRSSSQRP